MRYEISPESNKSKPTKVKSNQHIESGTNLGSDQKMGQVTDRADRNGFRNWQDEEKPRERLLKYGPESLTDVELLAILLGTGVQGVNVMELSRIILARFGNSIGNVARATVEELTKIKGLGPAKAITIITALELGVRRMQLQDTVLVVNDDTAVSKIMAPRMIDLTEEHFFALYLDAGNHVLAIKNIAVGDFQSVLVDVKSVLRHAIQISSHRIILCHNHPSKSLAFSIEDLRITKRLVEAAATMDIKVLDHVIIAGKDFASMASHPDSAHLFSKSRT